MKKLTPRYVLENYNFTLLVFVVLTMIVGIFAVGIAKESLQSRQILGVVCATIMMIVVSFIDYHLFTKFYWIIYIVNLILLALVLSGLGDDAGGAQRWLDIGIRFQPSELAKILLIFFFSQFIMVNRERLNSFKIIIASVILIGGPLLLVLMQPDLSTSIIITILFATMLFVGGLSIKIVLGFLAVFIPTAVILFSIVIQPDQTLIKSYQQMRILAWLHPEEYADKEAFQQINSKIAIGSGQLLGKGIAGTEIQSIQNGSFISQPQTDFIFAVIGEQWGFIGACAVIFLLGIVSLQCYITARKTKDLSGRIIAAAVGSMICFQSFVNISVTTGLLPNTGLPLPFISYGLTSLFSVALSIGVVLNVHLQSGRASSSGELRFDIE